MLEKDMILYGLENLLNYFEQHGGDMADVQLLYDAIKYIEEH